MKIESKVEAKLNKKADVQYRSWLVSLAFFKFRKYVREVAIPRNLRINISKAFYIK